MANTLAEPIAEVELRRARPDEFEALGQLTVEAYAGLPDMPGPDQMPEYYASLRDVAGRAAQPGVEVLVAVDSSGKLLGGVTFAGDMRYYGADAASNVTEAAGIRMLAVGPEGRNRGLGRALTAACIRRARELGRSEVVLHSTEVMQLAKGLYGRMGFKRSPDLDFGPDGFGVLGFRLQL